MSFVTVALLPNLEVLRIIHILLKLHFTALWQNTGALRIKQYVHLTCPLIKMISTSENVSFITVALLPNLEVLRIIRILLSLHFTALWRNTGALQIKQYVHLTCPLK